LEDFEKNKYSKRKSVKSFQKTACIACNEYFLYSYASVSLTVNLEARRAGIALASVPSTMVKINQAMIPLAP